MEPFLSPDGNTLFFNNLNDGVNTRLYSASKVDDTTFTLNGELSGANQSTPPHLDAVADLDADGRFYWTSTRDYPSETDNLFHGTLSGGDVVEIGRVRGDFYVSEPGWLLMDHGISADGQTLIYNNARFDAVNCTGPCETNLGIARKENDSTFYKTANSDSILRNVCDSAYIYYAPCITADKLELYFTRYLNEEITPGTSLEICVATRETDSGLFSAPVVLFSGSVQSGIVEAPTLSADKRIMYYHLKVGPTHRIMRRIRQQ